MVKAARTVPFIGVNPSDYKVYIDSTKRGVLELKNGKKFRIEISKIDGKTLDQFSLKDWEDIAKKTVNILARKGMLDNFSGVSITSKGIKSFSSETVSRDENTGEEATDQKELIKNILRTKEKIEAAKSSALISSPAMLDDATSSPKNPLKQTSNPESSLSTPQNPQHTKKTCPSLTHRVKSIPRTNRCMLITSLALVGIALMTSPFLLGQSIAFGVGKDLVVPGASSSDLVLPVRTLGMTLSFRGEVNGMELQKMVLNSHDPYRTANVMQSLTMRQRIAIMKDGDLIARQTYIAKMYDQFTVYLSNKLLNYNEATKQVWRDIEILIAIKSTLIDFNKKKYSLPFELNQGNKLELTLPFNSPKSKSGGINLSSQEVILTGSSTKESTTKEQIAQKTQLFKFTNKDKYLSLWSANVEADDFLKAKILEDFNEFDDLQKLLNPLNKLFSNSDLTNATFHSFFGEKSINEFKSTLPLIKQDLEENLFKLDQHMAKMLNEKRNAIQNDIIEHLGKIREMHRKAIKASSNLRLVESDDGIGWQIFKEPGLFGGSEETIFSFSIKLRPSEGDVLSIAPPEDAQRIGQNESLASDLRAL